MAVPLFDTSTPLVPLREEIIERLAAVAEGGALHPRPRGRGVRARVRGLPRRRARRRRGERDRRPDDRSARRSVSGPATRSWCRRSRSTRAPRRSRRPARRRCSATSTSTRQTSTLETVMAALTPANEGDHRRRPVRQPRAGQRYSRAHGPDRHRGRRAGRRRELARPSRRLARDGGDVLVLPLQEPRLLRRRRRDRDRRRRRSPSARARCASTARATRSDFDELGYNSRLDELQAAILRVMLPTSTNGRPAAARPARVYARRSASSSRCRSSRDGAEPAWHLYVVRHPEPTRSSPRSREHGRRGARLLPHPDSPPARDGRFAAGVELPATDELARTNLAIPIGPALAAEQAERSSRRSGPPSRQSAGTARRRRRR